MSSLLCACLFLFVAPTCQGEAGIGTLGRSQVRLQVSTTPCPHIVTRAGALLLQLPPALRRRHIASTALTLPGLAATFPTNPRRPPSAPTSPPNNAGADPASPNADLSSGCASIAASASLCHAVADIGPAAAQHSSRAAPPHKTLCKKSSANWTRERAAYGPQDARRPA